MHCFVSAGHGPKSNLEFDPGIVVPWTSGALAKALRIDAVHDESIEEHGLCEWIAREMAHAMTKATPVFVPRGSLTEKIAFVNRWSQPGDVAVEIHLNGGADGKPQGAETFYAQGSDKGKHLASILHAALAGIGRSPRGSKPDTQSARGKLGWCRNLKAWAAIVEVGFLTSPIDRTWLFNGGGREAGLALAAAIDGWI